MSRRFPGDVHRFGLGVLAHLAPEDPGARDVHHGGGLRGVLSPRLPAQGGGFFGGDLTAGQPAVGVQLREELGAKAKHPTWREVKAEAGVGVFKLQRIWASAGMVFVCSCFEKISRELPAKQRSCDLTSTREQSPTLMNPLHAATRHTLACDVTSRWQEHKDN